MEWWILWFWQRLYVLEWRFGEYDKNENVDGEYDESNFDALNDGTDFFNDEDEDDEDLSEFLDDFFNDEDE